jgi:uncharacterized protein with ParB-like and HNH nuclease domain
MSTTSILTTIQNLFGSNIYKIPDYQRGYAWEKVQVNDLLNDLENVENGKSHYTGTMVIIMKGEKKQTGEKFTVYEVIDGQQRLATISILLFCVYEELKAISKNMLSKEIIEKYGEPEKIAENILQKYIITERIQRLILNDDSRDYYFNIIIRDSNIVGIDKPENTSQLNLKNAKEMIRKYLSVRKARCSQVSNDEYFDYLNTLKSKVTDCLVVNKYEVEEDAEAGVIFEVMNDRGKSLSQADKIKNYLIYLAYKTENPELAKQINNYWGVIFRNLMASRRSSEDDFLRYHWIIYSNEYKEYDIHRRVKEKICLKYKNGNKMNSMDIAEQIKDYIDSLREASYIFLELNQPDYIGSFTDDAFSKYELIAEIKDDVNKFHRLRNIATFYPLFISARRAFKDKPEYFFTILRLAEIFTFRVYIIGNRRSNTKQTTFFRLAYTLYQQKGKEEKEKDSMFTEIKNELVSAIGWYGSDTDFEANLKRANFYWDMQTHETKYFFYELERHKAKEAKEEFDISWDDIEEKAQIEHIWSRTPKGYDTWSDEQKSTHSSCVHKLGNLTITGWNQTLSNRDFWDTEDFTGKKPIYEKSNLRVQRELAQNDSWDKSKIEEREKDLIKFGLIRWSSVW